MAMWLCLNEFAKRSKMSHSEQLLQKQLAGMAV
jgi:hypothetical protein